MGQGKAGDALLVCKCLFLMEGNKAVILSEIKTGMYLSHFCQTCAAGEDVTWGAQHPGTCWSWCFRRVAEQKHQISADHQEFSFLTQFLHVREAIEKCIYKWVAENSCHRTLLEKRDVSVLGRPILPQMMCHPRVAVYQISIVAVFTTGAEVEDNSRIYNCCEVFFLTPGWHQQPRNHFEYLTELLCQRRK